MIFTFYSYKGGVGRSMALANIAELFFQKGANVLMVDWDLEAPGLEKFFSAQLKEEKWDKPGVIDFLSAYKERLISGKAAKGDDEFPFEKPVSSVYNIHQGSGKGRLRLFSAGRKGDGTFSEYANAVLRFDWSDFYENCYGESYIEWLRREFEQMADIILIDSRTGVTEMGGVCTYQLADVNVMFCAANDQNIEGTFRMLQSFAASDLPDLRGGRELKTLVIPSRIEQSTELANLNRFRRMFKEKFTQYLPEKFQREPEFFKQHEIPYVVPYAFEEMIAINHPTEDSDYHSPGLIQAYKKLFQTLTLLANPQKILYVEDELVQNIPRLSRLFGNYLSETDRGNLEQLGDDSEGYGTDPADIKQIFQRSVIDVEYRFPDALAKILERPEDYALFIIDRNLSKADYVFEDVQKVDPLYSQDFYNRFSEREGDYLLLKLVLGKKVDVLEKFYSLTAYSASDEVRSAPEIRLLIDFGAFQEKIFIEKDNRKDVERLCNVIKNRLS